MTGPGPGLLGPEPGLERQPGRISQPRKKKGDRRHPRLPGGRDDGGPLGIRAGSGPSASLASALSGSRSGGAQTPFVAPAGCPVSRGSLPTTTTVPEPC